MAQTILALITALYIIITLVTVPITPNLIAIRMVTLLTKFKCAPVAFLTFDGSASNACNLVNTSRQLFLYMGQSISDSFTILVLSVKDQDIASHTLTL